MKKTKWINAALLVLSLSGIVFYIIRAAFRAGDFVGYVNAGRLTWEGQNIYSDYLNTWPPFFSVFAVPLYLADSWSSIGIRLVWLILSVLAMFWCMRIMVRWLFQKQLLLPFQKNSTNQIAFSDLRVFLPFLLAYRFLLDNLANIQINIFLLLMVLLAIDWYQSGRYRRAAAILTLGISLKVFPIFLLFFFIFKRASKMILWSIGFLILWNALTFWVYGYEEAMAYYRHWWTEIAGPFATIQHKNQSFFSMLRSWLTNESPGLDIFLNFANLSISQLKMVSYSLLLIGALYVMYWFKRSKSVNFFPLQLIEYTFILTAIPILSPLAWKAYFIFLWPAYLMLCFYLFYHKKRKEHAKHSFFKMLFYLAIALTVISTDLFLGPWLADVTEVFSCLTIGTLLLLGLLLYLYRLEKKKLL